MKQKSMKIIVGFIMFSVFVTGGTYVLNSNSNNKQKSQEEKVSLSNARPGFFTGGYNKKSKEDKKVNNPRVIYMGEPVPVVNVLKY